MAVLLGQARQLGTVGIGQGGTGQQVGAALGRPAQRLPAAWRPLLERIPGLRVLEPAEQDLCCGSAGIYNITEPDAARDLGDRKARNVLATEPDAYASANPGCLVQVSQALGRAGAPLPAFHPVELLDASIRGVGAADLLDGARR